MKSLKNKRKNEAKDAVIFLETSGGVLMNGGSCARPSPCEAPCSPPCTGGNLGPCDNSANGCTGSCGHSSK
jgi:hypothetical protein